MLTLRKITLALMPLVTSFSSREVAEVSRLSSEWGWEMEAGRWTTLSGDLHGNGMEKNWKVTREVFIRWKNMKPALYKHVTKWVHKEYTSHKAHM